MNIGVIGSGFIVGIFVSNIKQYKDVKLQAIWGRHQEKIEAFNEFKKHYTNIDEFLNDDSFDIVYVALPNSLHYEYALKALKANKHVMLEKPFCENYKQAKKLVTYAKKHKLFLFETIMTRYAYCYKKIKPFLKDIGDIKMVDVNFSQYSRKYDRFKNGTIMPTFDYKLAGGALMDIGVYNIHFMLGLFGLPKAAHYYPNYSRKVDTSGILILEYKDFHASLINSKDTKAPAYAIIQGEKGYIKMNSSPARCAQIEIVVNNVKTKTIEKNSGEEFSSWKSLYDEFRKLYRNKDLKTCYEYLEETLKVQKILDMARDSANIKY